MIYLALILLTAALLFALRTLWKQNLRLRTVTEAIQARRPHLRSEEDTDLLPAWPGLAGAVNRLITVTDELTLQSSDKLAQLEATLGNLREAVLIVDEANYIHLANRALREVFPAARNLVNLRLELIIRNADFLEYARLTRAGQSQPRQEFEIVEGKDTLSIEVSGAPIPAPDGKSQWALFVIHDMTQQRKLERLRRDFVANASHELRTPLSMIKGYVETLVDGHHTMSPEERDKFLRTIQRHSERLHDIIQDLLTLSRLESTTPGTRFEPVDLAPFLEAIAEEFGRRPQAATHTLTISASTALGTIQADAVKLSQVFGNLLENALKYTPPGSQIRLIGQLGVTGEIELTVQDNGPGIPAEDLPHIFERFYRVDKGRSRETGGTGLGLSIVKHIVQLHGGRVWAESEPGQGTTIRLRLPRHPTGGRLEEAVR